MLDKAKLGRRYTCYECGTKFYDLNRPTPLCPECEADQTNAPVRDIRSLLSGGGRKIERYVDDDKLSLDDDDDDDDSGLDDDDDDGIDTGDDDDDDDMGGGDDDDE